MCVYVFYIFFVNIQSFLNYDIVQVLFYLPQIKCSVNTLCIYFIYFYKYAENKMHF